LGIPLVAIHHTERGVNEFASSQAGGVCEVEHEGRGGFTLIRYRYDLHENRDHPDVRRYFGGAATGSFNHFATVLRESPVIRAISRSDFFSRL
jgi:hypothetical protein